MGSYADVEQDLRRLRQLVEIIESHDEGNYELQDLSLGEIALWCKDIISSIEETLKAEARKTYEWRKNNDPQRQKHHL